MQRRSQESASFQFEHGAAKGRFGIDPFWRDRTSGLANFAASQNALCCERGQMLRDYSLRGQKAGLSAQQTLIPQ
jgi:hypothetical protein